MRWLMLRRVQDVYKRQVLAHLARALDWQSKGGEFESRMLHFFNDKMKVCEAGLF